MLCNLQLSENLGADPLGAGVQRAPSRTDVEIDTLAHYLSKVWPGNYCINLPLVYALMPHAV